MKRLILLVLVLLVLVAGAPVVSGAEYESRMHVVMIDGSGSMEDPVEKVHLYSNGKLQSLVQGLVAVDAAFDPRDQVALGIFSKADKGRGLQSPVWVYHGTVAQLRANWPKLKPIQGWTDLVGALESSSDKLKSHKGPQMVWLLTDNIDQQSDTTEATDQWYASLAARDDLKRIYVFPIDVQEKRGLVLYAMARDRGQRYWDLDTASLDKAVGAINGSALRKQLGEGGFLVKPLSDEGLTVTVTGFVTDKQTNPDVIFEYQPDTHRIALKGYAEKQPIRGQFHITLTSRFPALKIMDAQIEAELVNVSSAMFVMPSIVSQKITPTRVSLAPGQKAEYTVDLNIDPPMMLWNPFKDPWAALEDKADISGELRLRVKDVTFAALQPDKYHKVAQIPEILGNRSKVPIEIAAPMTMQVGLGWERLLQVFLFLVLLVAVCWLIIWAMFGQRRYVRIYNADFDRTELISRKRRVEVPGFGYLRAGLFGGIAFVPQVGKHRRERPLRGRRGEITLEEHGTFFFDLRPTAPGKIHTNLRGGKKRASSNTVY